MIDSNHSRKRYLLSTKKDTSLFEQETDDQEAVNIEASGLLSTSISSKYESPLKTIASRINQIRGILFLMNTLQIYYYGENIFYLDDLVSFGGPSKIVSNRYATYSLYASAGLKVVYGSQKLSFILFSVGLIIGLMLYVITFLPVTVFDQQEY